ncbi:MAG: preprotein translocase subunit SecG [Candidatus Nomurabacteria bacterium]|nr:preprotein translocase subunit SecG [Candidatus Nomurabacteria bacterium]
MVQMLSIVQIALAILLTALILVQRANTDASGALGADGGSTATLKKRGGELMLHRLTVTTAVLFALTLAIPLILSR